jgi:hypothetical protein
MSERAAATIGASESRTERSRAMDTSSAADTTGLPASDPIEECPIVTPSAQYRDRRLAAAYQLVDPSDIDGVWSGAR